MKIQDHAEDAPEELGCVKRIMNNGQCRWSGVFDLAAEELLEARPGSHLLEQLLPLLVYAGRTALFRRGGVASFATLAVQMLVCGYPSEPVILLRKTLPPGLRTPSLALLDHVCALYTATPHEVPGMLAALIAKDMLPPKLAAQIHYQRVLKPKMRELRVSSKYERGRKLVDLIRTADSPENETGDQRLEEAAELSKVIQQATHAFVPNSVKPLKSPNAYRFEAIPLETIPERYNEVASAVNPLRRFAKRIEKIAALISAGAGESTQEKAFLANAVKTVTKLREKAEQANHRLDLLLAATHEYKGKGISKKFGPNTKICRKVLNQICYDTRMINEIREKFDGASEKIKDGHLPEKELAALDAEIDKVLSGKAGKKKRNLPSEFEAFEAAVVSLVEIKARAFEFLKTRIEAPVKSADTQESLGGLYSDHAAFGELIPALKESAEKGLKALGEIVQAVAAMKDSGLIPDFDKRQADCRQNLQSIGVLGPLIKKQKKMGSRFAKAGIQEGGAVSEALVQWLASIRSAFSTPVEEDGSGGPADPRKKSEDPIRNFMAESESLKNDYDHHWKRIRILAEKHKKGKLDKEECKECGVISRFVEAAQQRCKSVQEEVQKRRSSGAANAEEELACLNKAEDFARELLSRNGIFNKKLKRLPTPPREESAIPSDEVTREKESASDIRKRPQDPCEGLAFDLDTFRDLIEKDFEETVASFRPYADLRDLPPLRNLYIFLLDRQARLMAELGHRGRARKLWSSVLVQDRLNADSLKNIAVCDTFGQDVAQTLASWRSYAETLYFLAIARGNPAFYAKELAFFHHQFGGAYAPAELSQPLKPQDDQKVDPIALTAFLRSPGRVRLFVEHKLAAFLNAKLEFSSPPLILGTGRTDSERNRRKALNGLTAFVRQIKPLLPERVRNAFAATVCKHLDQAFETCKSAKKLTLKNDTRYGEEQALHEQWIKDVCHFKIRIFKVINENMETVKEIPSPDFLCEFQRLDDIPISQQPSFLQAIGARLGINDAEMLQNLMSVLQGRVVNELFAQYGDDNPSFIWDYLIKMVSRGGTDPQMPRVLMNLAIKNAKTNKSAHGHTEVDDAVSRWIEYATNRLNPDDEADKKQAEEVDNIALKLEQCLLEIFLAPVGGLDNDAKWQEKEKELLAFLEYYPYNGTGHFMLMVTHNHLAVERINEGKTKEGAAYFEKAVEEAGRVLEYSHIDNHREQAEQLLENADAFRQQIGAAAAKSGNYAEALGRMVPMLAGDDATPDLVKQVMTIFVQEARDKKDGSKHSEMAAAVNGWIQRVRNGSAHAEEPQLAEIEGLLDEYLAMMFLASQGDLNDNTNWAEVEALMRSVRNYYPENVSCRYYRMMALYRIANSQAESGQKKQARQTLAASAEEADVVIERTRNDSQRKQAQNLREQAKRVLDVEA